MRFRKRMHCRILRTRLPAEFRLRGLTQKRPRMRWTPKNRKRKPKHSEPQSLRNYIFRNRVPAISGNIRNSRAQTRQTAAVLQILLFPIYLRQIFFCLISAPACLPRIWLRRPTQTIRRIPMMPRPDFLRLPVPEHAQNSSGHSPTQKRRKRSSFPKASQDSEPTAFIICQR